MDEFWMRHCIQLGKAALVQGNPPVGSVVVKAGMLIGQGLEAGKTKNDVTCHAEVEAIRDCLQKGISDFSGTALYSTHEPCILCSYVIRQYKIPEVVFSLPVPEIGGLTSAYPVLSASDISIWPQPPVIRSGILSQECEQLNTAYQFRKLS